MTGYLRESTLDDLDLLFEWANDSEVRGNAFNSNRIAYEQHVAWYKQSLENSNRKQYIYIYNEEPIGQIRVDIEEDVASIDYSISALNRGKGHGKKMLQLLKNKLQDECPKIKMLRAQVKSENVASQKAFLGTGYKEIYRQYEIEI